jgi:hypothetical protein
MLQRPGILALLFAIAATTGLSLMAAPAGYAPAPRGLSRSGPADSVCVQANPAHGGAGIELDAEWHPPGNPAGLGDLRSLGNGNRRIQDYGNGLCVRAAGSKDNSAVWA